MRQTQEPRPVERPQPRQEPEPRRPVRPEARKSRNQRPQTNQKAQLKTEALPVLQQGPKAQAAARTEPMLRATPHSVSDMKPRPASVPVPVHAVPPKSTSDETVFKRVRWTTFPWLSKKVVVTFFATFLAFAGGIIYLNMTVPVVNIIVSDRHFGYTASLNEAMEIVYDAVHTLGEEKIDDVNIMTDDKVFYVTQRVDKKTFEENQASVDDIAQYINTYLPGFGVSVNGEETDIVVATKEEADGVLSDLLEYYQNLCDKGTQLVDNEIYSVAYEEDVLVEETKALPLYMKTQEEALQGLIDGRPVAKTHEVESEEETVADIAQAYGIGAENILEVNKDLSAEEELEVGTLVKFFVIEPYFTVVVEGKRVAVEAIDFAVETRKEPRVLKGTSKVEQEGVLGSKDITFTFVSRNGKIDLSNENAYVVLDENVTKEPESRIVLEGTGSTSLGSSASVKISQGSGDVPVMKWPASGTLTSKYRTASRPNHNGIDIANPVGTPIYAAADGTVLFVGWHGGYGNAIVIDHGDGVGTRYAHLSSFNVGAGDTVSKGQTIGGMGNTGNSTGPHLHFEVFINQTGTSYYIDPEAVTYG
ncbi:MAG: peptidoglycan DD-metalloendopeptidase family protein [Peptococcaceae bacterium]|nr:peptidoglycan DD-metalloendopeptidase family protein [Peptococcaceae bacterium]